MNRLKIQILYQNFFLLLEKTVRYHGNEIEKYSESLKIQLTKNDFNILRCNYYVILLTCFDL